LACKMTLSQVNFGMEKIVIQIFFHIEQKNTRNFTFDAQALTPENSLSSGANSSLLALS